MFLSFLDLKKVIDTVNRSILLHKTRSPLFLWDYVLLVLFVFEKTYNTDPDPTARIKVAMLQGSILGLSLFIAYLRLTSMLNFYVEYINSDDVTTFCLYLMNKMRRTHFGIRSRGI